MSNETITKIEATKTVEAKATFVPEVKVQKPDDLLVSILRTKRAHSSPGDTSFRMWLHAELKRMSFVPQILAEGCIMVRTDVKSDTLFSCHIDTVHSVSESDGSHQDLVYDPSFDQIFLQKGQKSSCLGADDGAGIYIMLKMLQAKVPGTFIFHTGEERGGIGSKAVLQTNRLLLDDFSRAIAFDRKCDMGTSPEVIVTQGGRPCASPSFGLKVVAELNKAAKWLQPWVLSHGGSFTDTKTYAGIIPECLNLSCFYEQAHTPNESLDVERLELLVQAACKIKWDELKAERKPAEEPKQPRYIGNMSDMFRREMDAENHSSQPKGKKQTGFPTAPPKSVPKPVAPAPSIMEEISSYTCEHFQALVEEDPDLAARVMAMLVMKNVGLQSQLAFFETYLDLQ